MASRDLLSADHFPRRLGVAGREDVESLRVALDAGSHLQEKGGIRGIDVAVVMMRGGGASGGGGGGLGGSGARLFRVYRA